MGQGQNEQLRSAWKVRREGKERTVAVGWGVGQRGMQSLP